MDPIAVRGLSALLMVLLGLGAYRLLTWRQLARAQRKTFGLEGLRRGVPAILYFTTPSCQPCKTIQRPALQALSERLGDRLQIVRVDASEETDLADYWGVLSVPTTFIIDSHGQPRGVNHGAARADKLMRQLEAAEGGPLLPPGGEAGAKQTKYSSVS
jgi:thioredoxin 1